MEPNDKFEDNSKSYATQDRVLGMQWNFFFYISKTNIFCTAKKLKLLKIKTTDETINFLQF